MKMESLNFKQGQQRALPLPEKSASGANGKAETPALLRPTREFHECKKLLITPEQARLWITEYNTRNRDPKDTRPTQYGLDMLEGRWMYNRVPIQFDWNLEMVDGQHRLLGSIEANVPFYSDVYFGVDPAIRPTIDIGLERSLADQFKLDDRDIQNAKLCGAIAWMIVSARRNGDSKIFEPSKRPSKPMVKMAANNGELPLLADAAHMAATHSRLGCGASLVGFCWYRFAEQNRPLAESFFRELKTGLNLTDDNAVYWLRKRLEGNRTSRAKLRPRDLIALFFKAWIAYRDEKPLYQLKWSADAQFPNIGPVPGLTE